MNDVKSVNNEVKDYVVEFLVTEYTELNQEFRRLRVEGLNRLNFFIAITSSVLAGLVILSQSGQASIRFLQFVAIGALIFLILIGWDTFRFTVSRDVSTDHVMRRMGRIRHFYVDQYPPIEKYLPWQTHDEPTKWVLTNNSGIRQTAQSILSLLFALLVVFLISLMNNLLISIVGGGVAFIIAFMALRGYSFRHYEKASRNAFETAHFLNNDNKK